MGIVLALASVVLTVLAVPAMWALAHTWKLGRTNFKGKQIPTGFGFLVVLAAAPVYAAAILLFGAGWYASACLVVVLGFGALGLFDDVYGTRGVGGFRGHLSLLRQGRVSSGLVKAVVGGGLGLGVGAAIARFDPVISLVNGLVISLAANTLNLLDLRPGRAVSCFWVGLLALAAVHSGRAVVLVWLIPVLVPAVWLTVLDRSARVMLGDAGSNVLGAVFGLAIVYGVGVPTRVVLIVLMAGVHLYTEKYSVSELIDGNRVLRSIDQLLGER